MEVRLLRTAQEKAVLRPYDGLVDHFDCDMLPYRSYLAAFEGDEVLGLVCFNEASMRVPGAFGIGFIATRAEYRNRGVACALVTALFSLAQAESRAISNTPYEEDGEKWLRPVMQRTHRAFPSVAFHER